MNFKNKLITRYFIVFIFIVSLSATVFLQFQTIGTDLAIKQKENLETTVMEGCFLPDVTLVKQLLRTLFNVVKL